MSDTPTGEGPPHEHRDPGAGDAGQQRSAVLRLVVVLVSGVAAAVVTGTGRTVAVVVALIAMIMLHELGHFLTAKWSGMKVTEFFVGFGPRLWSVRRGETEYGVKAIPAGGYVKIIGMNNLDKIDDPRDEPRTYRQKAFPQRLAVAMAGSTMHFLIAFVLFLVINTLIGLPGPSTTIGELSRVEGGASPAEEAGFRVGDRILSVDGRTFERWEDIPPYIRERPGQELQFRVERDGRPLDLVARPADLSEIQVDGVPATDRPTGFIGIGPEVAFETRGPVAGVVLAARQLVGGDFLSDTQVAPGLVDNARALGDVFSVSGIRSYGRTLVGEPQPERDDGGTRFISPVGFVRVAGEAAGTGLFEVLILLIAINIFIGLFNLLPLLPLDGGHVAIAVYETIREKITRRRHRVDVTKLLPVTYAVVLLMIFLGVSALYLDITRPLSFD